MQIQKVIFLIFIISIIYFKFHLFLYFNFKGRNFSRIFFKMINNIIIIILLFIFYKKKS